MSERMNNAAFWPQYLDAHRDPRTRAIHYLGTILGVCSFVVFLVTLDWRFLLAAPILGYGLAMPTHPIFEGNLPKTFEHPALSFVSDFYCCSSGPAAGCRRSWRGCHLPVRSR